MHRGLMLACLVFTTTGSFGAGSVPPKLKSLVDQVEVAWDRQNPGLLWNLLEQPARTWRKPQITLLDETLRDRELPSSGQMLADARMSFVLQNFRGKMPEMNLQVRLLVIQGLQERSTNILKEVHDTLGELAKQDSPRSFDQFEKRFWELHIQINRLVTAKRFRRYAVDQAARVKGTALANLEPSRRDSLRNSDEASVSEVLALQAKVTERDRQLRHARLDYSIQRLGQDNLDKEKFKAAFAIRLDSDVLARVDQTRNKTSQTKVKDALTAAGDLPQKATDFFVGLHWWLRGRYGNGAEVGGLAKSEAALKFRDGLVWLNMPRQAKAAPAASRGQLEFPGGPYHRRHHLLWAWEDRPVYAYSRSSNTKTSLGKNSYKMSSFW